MEVLLMFYALFNVVIIPLLTITCLYAMDDNFNNLFFYPLVNSQLKDVSLTGKIIIHALITIFILPTLIFYYVIIVAMFLCGIICSIFASVFKKKEK